MEPTEKIAVRLTPEIVVALKVLVDRGEVESMSDAVRQAMEEFIFSRFTPEELSMMVPEIYVEYSDSENHDESSVEAMNRAIHDAVTGFVRAKMESKDEEPQEEGKKTKSKSEPMSESEED